MNKFNITLGADPEIFICNEKEIVSAEGLTDGGTKQNPKMISDEGHAIQEDGIMFEYNIPACKTEDEWVNAHKYCIDYLSILANVNGYSLSNKVSDKVNKKYLKSIQASTFGCEPDYNVYSKSINEAPDNNTNLRCAGGHVAFGYENPEFETSEKIVKSFDMFVTLPALFKDNDTRRRELYGKAGSFRVKSFGVECRSLSNFWIQSEENMRWVYKQSIRAIEAVLSNEIDELISLYSEQTRQAIDSADLVLAKELLIKINKYEKELINT